VQANPRLDDSNTPCRQPVSLRCRSSRVFVAREAGVSIALRLDPMAAAAEHSRVPHGIPLRNERSADLLSSSDGIFAPLTSVSVRAESLLVLGRRRSRHR
jgi:hypothetical protein